MIYLKKYKKKGLCIPLYVFIHMIKNVHRTVLLKHRWLFTLCLLRNTEKQTLTTAISDAECNSHKACHWFHSGFSYSAKNYLKEREGGGVNNFDQQWQKKYMYI